MDHLGKMIEKDKQSREEERETYTKRKTEREQKKYEL